MVGGVSYSSFVPRPRRGKGQKQQKGNWRCESSDQAEQETRRHWEDSRDT